MPKLIILSSNDPEYQKQIQKANLPDLEISRDPAECDIVLGEPSQIRDALPHLTQLKWAQSEYAGVELLVDPSQRRDYILTNARDVFGNSMSEFVFGYILYFKKRIAERLEAQSAKKWDDYEEGNLQGKTLGLLGVGSIGAHLAKTAKHFGMNVYGYTMSSEDCEDVDTYFHGSDILEFASELDYLVSVMPRTNKTNKIIDSELLKSLPNHAILINVGRGNAIDELALIEALNDDQIAAAVLDVTDPEPLPVDHPFWITPKLFLTFHTAAMSYPKDITKLFAANYALYVKGKKLKYQVDFSKGY